MRRALVVALVVVGLAAAAAAPAWAGRRVIVRGGGAGHGIGMSQYGAYGRALNGWGAERILEHYFTGTEVGSKPSGGNVRVGLLQYEEAISFTSSGPVSFKLRGSDEVLAEGGRKITWKVAATGSGKMALYRDGARVRRDGRRSFGGRNRALVLTYSPYGSTVSVADTGRRYSDGRMELTTWPSSSCAAGHCLALVASLPMQRYLYGLSEMSASWPKAALRAQVIAGRTYALDKMRRLGSHRFPCNCAVYDSSIDQVFVGDEKRLSSGDDWDRWRRAVDRSKKEVVTYRDAPIQVFYFSSSGGHTESNENVWGGTPIPYLRGVPDRADAVAGNPSHRWRIEMSWRAFSAALDAAFGTGRLERFTIVEPLGVSGRVTVVKGPDRGGVRIRGSERTVRVDGWDVRTALGLPDTLFRVEVVRT